MSGSGIPILAFDEVKSLAEAYFGVAIAKVSALGSCQDANFKVTDVDNNPFVMKFSNASCSKQEIIFQNDVILYLNSCEHCSSWTFPLPQRKIAAKAFANDRVPSAASYEVDNLYIAEIPINGIVYYTRLLVYVKGDMLSSYKYFSHEVLTSFGSFVATISNCLSTFSAEGSDRPGLQVYDRQIIIYILYHNLVGYLFNMNSSN